MSIASKTGGTELELYSVTGELPALTFAVWEQLTAGTVQQIIPAQDRRRSVFISLWRARSPDKASYKEMGEALERINRI